LVKSVLFVSIDGMTDPLGQSQVLPYMVGLSKCGFKITIISAEKPSRFLKQKSTIEKIVDESSIIWIPINYYSSMPIISPAFNFLKLRSVCLNYVSKNKVDIVHCRSYLTSLIGLKIKRKFDTKFIFDMRGFFADERLDGGIWNKKSLIKGSLYGFFKRKEIDFFNNSDYTISLTHAAKNEILKWQEVKKNLKIKVIPCCVDIDFFSINNLENNKRFELQNKLKITNSDFVISYLGSTGTWYLFDEMLDFFKILTQAHTRAKFLIITQDDKEFILKKADEKGIDKNQLIILSANRAEVPVLLNMCKVSIFFIKPTFSKMASSPTKMGEILAMGIPVITNCGVGDVDAIIIESGCGVLIDKFTDDSYKFAVSTMDLLFKKDKSVYIETAKKYFSLNKGIENYKEVYDSL
jgi:glycosyltransferase involved in cell wall biosynthesis